jgi:RNA polymerase sigma-70 factor (ECF subfamily)
VSDRNPEDISEAYVTLLTSEQLGLLYYITMLLGDPHAAENVLQETNLVLWRKSHEYRPGTNFSAWAHKIAYWQTLAYVRDRNRDRHVFNEVLISQLANRDTELTVNPESRVALRDCLQQAKGNQLEMLRFRYELGLNAATIANRIGRTEIAVRAALARIRRTLQKCIESKLSKA